MGKDNVANYYYAYNSSTASGSTSSPSAPDHKDVADLPAYSDVVTDYTAPPAKQPLADHVRDHETIPAFNPSTSDAIPDYDEDDATRPLLAPEPVLEEDPFSGRPPPPGYSLYRAPYETRNDGSILSRDRHLNSDGEALVQFLKVHNTPPKMAVRFHGYHEETHYVTRTRRDSDGNTVEEHEPVTRIVDDFDFKIDCSQHVHPVCQGLYVLPDKKTGESKTVRQLCDDYVHEKNQLKELRMTKFVDWNYPELTRAFTAAIRAQGYHHAIEITYETTHDRVMVKTASTISRMADDRWVRGIFFITCLWIIAWPILWLMRKQFGHATLKSRWIMNISEREWYNQHVTEVLQLV